jgi:DNA-binding winged helix-turn-helix (wHTH) protein
VKLRFADCLFDGEARQLRRGPGFVALTPKAFELLELLLERRPNAVAKAEIRDRLWPRTAVSDVNLATLAFEVRAAIGDDARRPRHLRTVRAYGYAFTGEVVDAGPGVAPARCRLVLQAREVPLREGEHLLGRASEASVVLDAARVSRLHARIRVEGERAVLEDLGSKNGTFLQGRRIDGPVPLEDGDAIRVGSERIVFRTAGRDAPTSTADRETG